MVKSEYHRVRSNLLSILSRARRDGIGVEDLYLKVPEIPKKITEASVRRISKIHAEIKHEVAKRRRKAKKYKLPPRRSKYALSDLEVRIENAVSWVKDTVIARGRTIKISPRYQEMIRKSGAAARKLLDDMIEKAKREAAKQKPKPQVGGTATYSEWLEATAENLIINRAESLLRIAEEKVNHFLFGYGDPGDIRWDKPTDYMIMRALLGQPVSSEEMEDMFGDLFNMPEYDYYE